MRWRKCRAAWPVLEAGDGALLSAICERGVDAYGVDPRVDSVDAARRRGVDVRLDDVTGHLQAVAPGDLAGVVLRACVERLAAGELLQLLDLATRAFRAGGRCIVVERDTAGVGSNRSRVEADLARGRPLHPETWVRLLEAQGYDGVDVRTLGDEGGLTPVAGDGPDAAVVNANLAAHLRSALRSRRVHRRRDPPRVTAIHQFVPTLAPRDAVGAHYLAVQATLRGAGYRSDIYAYEAKHEFKKPPRPFKSYRGERRGEPTWLLYHSSVGSPVADFVRGRDRAADRRLPQHHARRVLHALGAVGRRAVARTAGDSSPTLEPRAARTRRLRVQRGRAPRPRLPAYGGASRSCSTSRALDRPADAALVERLHAARDGAARLAVRRPARAEQGATRPRQGVRRVPPVPRSRRAACTSSAARRRTATMTALRDFIGALDLDGAVDIAGQRQRLRELARVLRRLPTCSSCAASTKASACRCSRRCTIGVPIVAYAAAAVPETLGDAGLLLGRRIRARVAAAVDRVVSDADLREQLVAAGERRLARLRPRLGRAKLLDAVIALSAGERPR